MNFTINRTEFLEALKIVYPAVKQSIVIPICETIKFDILDDKAILTATNIQVELSVAIKGLFAEKGSFCLPATKLVNLISNLPDQPITIEVQTKIAIIKTSNGKYELPLSNPADFPIFKVEPDKSIIINAELFYSAIKKTVFACSDDDLKPQQTGVFIEIVKDKILFTSTDAHRVNHVEHTIQETELNCSIIIPASSLNIMPQVKDAIKVLFGGNNLSILSDRVCFKSILIDAEFPAYRDVIPVNDKILTIDRNLLLSAIKRVSAFANFSTNALKIELSENIKLSGTNTEFSEYAEEILEGDYKADSLTIGLSAEYLQQSVNSTETENIYMLFSEANRGVLIKEDLEDNNYIMVMPKYTP